MYRLQKMARIKRTILSTQKRYFSFRKILGFWPRKIRYYDLALRHKSLSLHNADGSLMNNERLEFLGDSILDALVADVLYRHFEKGGEGFLTNTRSKIVKRETLNKLAIDLGLDKMMMVANNTNSLRKDIFGNTLEALFGAIYLDRGYEACRQFLEKKILEQLLDLESVAKTVSNYKSLVLEWCQQKHYELEFPTYPSLRSDEDTSLPPSFECELLINGKLVAKAKGYSKKNAQQEASKLAWAEIQKNQEKLILS